MLEKFNRMENNKKIPMVIGIALLLIIFIIVFSYFRNKSLDYSDIKEYSDKAFVYTINSETNGSFFINVPYVNIAGSLGKEINEDIDSYVADFMENDKVMLSYEYNINGKIVSLVIKAVDYSTKNVPTVYFKTYNIDIENQVLLSDDDLLNIYNITTDDVDGIIGNQFLKWYEDVQKQGYINEEECDFECFLGYRNVEYYLDDVSYYIDRGRLAAYKPFVFYSMFGEENYFKESDFEFILAE